MYMRSEFVFLVFTFYHRFPLEGATEQLSPPDRRSGTTQLCVTNHTDYLESFIRTRQMCSEFMLFILLGRFVSLCAFVQAA